ncbi:chemotaxis response regulator protein-glutamate methylesterase [Tissierella sp. MSJ-40]|uniref:Protein-glutamate methylesterase/protein-glutamine glutaminase n=1 Tax=Tissierella simiarum TaxID=2841534 RepID=A0ABS6E463_9FIRM|nr:chemotaxis response regulator protein-glutamate methylesterase [Tissierella simiarum]MBU5437686.1 chemotaxis response regulator protein-glutamate methylesterase [Tissierella simiarum]
MIKVLIVDDSALIRKVLTDILKEDKEIDIVGTARNGKDALEKIPLLNPDIITLDVEMPIMDGLTTLKNIMSTYKLPVIMISSLTKEGADLTLKALDEGAVDFIPKPKNVFNMSESDIKREIIDKIKIGAKTKVEVTTNLSSLVKPTFSSDKKLIKIKKDFSHIVAIGTSTGGPRALQNILPLLPHDINASIVVVQHMPPKFTKSLADRLNSMSNINIKEAEEGDILNRGWCYIAPGDYHMEAVKEGGSLVIRLNQEPPTMGLRPTVDILMKSVASIEEYAKTGVILTGMGSDGARGISEMKKRDSYTIAQDESTSVVFGMPKSSIATNNIDEILPLNRIANRIINIVGV